LWTRPDSVEEKLQQFQSAAPQQRTAMIQEFLAKDGHSRHNHADDLLAASLFSPTSANAFSSCLDSHRDPFASLAFHSGAGSRRPHDGFAQTFASVVGV
jgi:hypothetical protein